mgnify:CR=1 FL=1
MSELNTGFEESTENSVLLEEIIKPKKTRQRRKYATPELFWEQRRLKDKQRKTINYYKKNFNINLKEDQIEMAKLHRKVMIKALPILDFLNTIEVIKVIE